MNIYSEYVSKNQNARIAINAVVNAGLGYAFARVFSIFSPGHAALFCATTAMIKDLADQKFKKDLIFKEPKNQDLAFFANRCVCILISCAIVHLTGVHLGFSTGVVLWLTVSLTKAIWDDVIVRQFRKPEYDKVG